MAIDSRLSPAKVMNIYKVINIDILYLIVHLY